MSRPMVAVVGSVAETRTFNPAITDSAQARLACVALGSALAAAGWDLGVFSGGHEFAEVEVVEGYLHSGPVTTRSIRVMAPLGKTGFEQFAGSAEAFDIRPDPSTDWEVSFYRALVGMDGVLLIGGGRSTLIAGLLAITLDIPVVAVATFGGNARKVWEHLHTEPGEPTGSHRKDEVSGGADIAAMAAPWGPGSAERLVTDLDAQRKRRVQRERLHEKRRQSEARRAGAGLSVTIGILLALVAGLSVTWGWRLSAGWSTAILALLPALAGAGGALIRASLDVRRDRARVAVLGSAAGFVTGLLYVASQLIGVPDVLVSSPDSIRRLLFFVVPIGFVAGLTFDALYTKLRGQDVSQVHTLDAMTTAPRSPG